MNTVSVKRPSESFIGAVNGMKR